MRLFSYYAIHSFLGALRKLFKTWVVILILVCFLLGAILGVLGSLFEGAIEEEDVPVTEEVSPGPEEEFSLTEWETRDVVQWVEVFALAGVIFLFGLSLWTGEKSGSQIFTMADVNLLFPSPRSPQSVLLFRLCTRMGAYLLASLYLIFQLPNLIYNLGVPAPVAWSLLGVLFLALLFQQLSSMLVFSLAQTYDKLRGLGRKLLYALGLIVAASLFYASRQMDGSFLGGALWIASLVPLRFVPVLGWLFAVPALVWEGKYTLLLLDGAALILSALFLIRVIWRLKVDFYEEAMQKAGELEETRKRMEEKGKGFAVRRKKDRSEKLLREMPLKGSGASVFFFKSLFNRFRLAKGRVFTVTSLVYLGCGVAFPLFARFVAESDSVLFLAVPFTLVVFIRAFGNPIGEDVSKSFFILIPQRPYAKIFYSSLGGTVNTLLDLIPGLIVGFLILKAHLIWIPILLIFFLCFDFYASSFGAFADLSLPESIPQKIKSGIQVILIYFSVIPCGVILLMGVILHRMAPFVFLASGAHFAIGLLFLAFSSMILERGKK